MVEQFETLQTTDGVVSEGWFLSPASQRRAPGLCVFGHRDSATLHLPQPPGLRYRLTLLPRHTAAQAWIYVYIYIFISSKRSISVYIHLGGLLGQSSVFNIIEIQRRGEITHLKGSIKKNPACISFC